MRTLYPFQEEALVYARSLSEVALFMEMRLGKTIVMIRGLQERFPESHRRILVVCPASVLPTWQRELALEGETDVVLITGTRINRQAMLASHSKWNIANKEIHLVAPEIANIEWDAVILDESTFLKNPRAKVSQFFCRHFRTVPFRAIMAGVPAPESLLDFFQQFKFLHGGMMKCNNYYAFRSRYFNERPWSHTWEPYDGAEGQIERWAAKFSFVLQRSEVGIELPRVYESRHLELPSKLRRSYNRAEKDFLLAYGEFDYDRTKYGVTQYVWLRRMCGGWLGSVKQVWRGKQSELVRLLIGELSKTQVVVWFYFNAELAYALRALRKVGVNCTWITGKTDFEERRRRIESFRCGRRKVLLAQVGCVHFGEDLSAASTAIYFSSPTSCLQRTQSEDRLFHPEKKEPLLYIDLVVHDSVETDLLELLQRKKDTAVSVSELCRVMSRRYSHTNGTKNGHTAAG